MGQPYDFAKQPVYRNVFLELGKIGDFDVASRSIY